MRYSLAFDWAHVRATCSNFNVPRDAFMLVRVCAAVAAYLHNFYTVYAYVTVCVNVCGRGRS